MTVKIFDRPDIQEFLRELSGLNNGDGNPRMKEITHRLMSDLFKAIDNLNITPDEYWAGVAWLNDLGVAGQAGLISPGLGLDHFIDAALGIDNPTPRTIEGPLYVAGAPVEQGFARLDDGRDIDGQTLIMHGVVHGSDDEPLPGAQVEVWHCDTRGFYSHFDPTGLQADFNMRRTIIADENGRYKFQSILPSGYGVLSTGTMRPRWTAAARPAPRRWTQTAGRNRSRASMALKTAISCCGPTPGTPKCARSGTAATT